MKRQKENPSTWNDSIRKMNDEGMFKTPIKQENKLDTVKNMLNSIMTNGLAMEECNKAEFMDYICEIKKDIQNVIGYIENGN